MATRNGARPTGYAGEIGALLPGMKADMILVDLEAMLEDPCMLPGFDMGEVLIRRGFGRYTDTVVVNGEKIMEHRKLLKIDVDALFEEVREQTGHGRTQVQLDNEAFLNRIKPYYQAWYNSWLEEIELKPFYQFNSRY